MKVNTATFIISNTDVNKCPKDNIPEYAFIGRSNVGKSSLINALTDHKKLAKTSGKPGKTQLINHFKINDSWFLVDLPGYGYAQVSKSKRKTFQSFIKDYLMESECIQHCQRSQSNPRMRFTPIVSNAKSNEVVINLRRRGPGPGF